MIFVAECPFCRARMRVTDHASGSIGICPRCTSSFTLAPADDLRLPGYVGASPGRDGESDIENESIHASGGAAVVAEPLAAATIPTATESLTWPDAGSTPDAVSSRLRPEVLAGAAALLLGGSALLCASFSSLCGLVAPLSGLGLVTGGVALVLARFAAKGGLLLPVAGSVAAGAILNVALFFPAMLGPTYERSRQGGDPARSVLRAVPLGSGPVISQTPEWVNASQFALQRGDLRVQIVGVSIDPVPGTTKSKPRSPQPGTL